MIEIQYTDSLFDLPQNEHEAVAITTNGVIRKNGCATMGKGQALEAKQVFSGIDTKLGQYLSRFGNRAFYMGIYPYRDRMMSLVTFPTKQNYWEYSNLNLIASSAQQVKKIADKFKLDKIYLPPVGCGLGGLNYEHQVRAALQMVFDDDRFIVVRGYQNT